MEINRNRFIKLLSKKLKFAPAVVLLGARQVGKTYLSKAFAKSSKKESLYLDLENPNDINKLKEDPIAFFNFNKNKLIILDEIQTAPKLYNSLRSIIDANKKKGRFILLGSASPLLVKGISESLAGRVSYIDLSPFKFEEIKANFSLESHWFSGGFPNALLAESDEERVDWISAFVRSYVERDLNVLFDRSFNAVLARRLWTMIAHQQGGLLNANNLSRSLGVTAPVVNRYIDFMEGAFIVNRLLPWHSNTKKRLVKSPKLYILDTGLLHFFHQIKSFDDLLLHPIIGASWETYVYEQIKHHKPENTQLYFYRTHNDAEIDLLLVEGGKPKIAIEIKLSNSPKISKGFFICCEDLGVKERYVITPHADSYPAKNNSIVISLWSFINLNLIK